MVGRSVGWLVGWLVGQLVGWLVGCVVGLSVGLLVGWSFAWLVCWLVGWGGAEVFDIMHGRSRTTMDPRIPTLPGRSTSGFHRPGRHWLHQA